MSETEREDFVLDLHDYWHGDILATDRIATAVERILAEHVDTALAEVERRIVARKRPTSERGAPGSLERAVYDDALRIVRDYRGGDDGRA
jgi:hypothetical protein